LREGQASHQDSNKKWERKCQYCGDKWSLGHKCNNKNYILVKKRKNQEHLIVIQITKVKRKVMHPNTKTDEAMPKISLAAIK
jgi:hypothetical protein